MRSAIVGCGGIGNVHAYNINNMQDHKLVAFADIDLEKAKKFVEDYGDSESKAYSSLEEMIENEKIDVLHICTPHYLHVPMAIQAANRNINVFMEKPLAISEDQVQKLRDVNKKVQIGVCFQNRYNKSVQYIRNLLQNGKAGKILGARAILTWSRGEKYYTQSGWRGSLKTEGGGVLINQAIHTLDLLIYFLGKPKAVEGTIINHHLKGIIDVEDTAEAYVQFNEVTASFYATNAFCTNSPVLLELVCENMIVKMEDTEITITYPDNLEEKLSFKQEQLVGKNYWGNGHFACISHYYDCIQNNKHFPIDIEEAFKALQLLLGIYESSENKTIVNF